jgi:hypothetical protein
MMMKAMTTIMNDDDIDDDDDDDDAPYNFHAQIRESFRFESVVTRRPHFQ